MEITTKFSKGDTVFWMDGNIIKSFVVCSIKVQINDYYDNNIGKQLEYYSPDYYGKTDFVFSKSLFKDVESLLSNLKNNVEKYKKP